MVWAQNKTIDLRLAEGRRVFVEKSERDADVWMVKELQNWGRWKIVGDRSEAELIVRIRTSGNPAWGLSHVVAYVLDPSTMETLWMSRDHRGTRNLFHGYASPFARSIDGIAKQMKSEIR